MIKVLDALAPVDASGGGAGGGSMARTPPRLKTIDLGLNSSANPVVKKLAATLGRMKTLRRLNLNMTGNAVLTEEGVVQLSNQIGSSIVAGALLELRVEGCRFGDVVLETLHRAVPRYPALRLLALSLASSIMHVDLIRKCLKAN